MLLILCISGSKRSLFILTQIWTDKLKLSSKFQCTITLNLSLQTHIKFLILIKSLQKQKGYKELDHRKRERSALNVHFPHTA